ncbi:solute carrier family 22 member 4-like [Zerene cesonia]|uniref:solute carrier family 22 member 4-like n=1 Tax=Zerene cesonia TaxID=33412 RepID=UPI0018E58266|nr:solute carrier family 22 member 4-like [Zerene cesonia]
MSIIGTIHEDVTTDVLGKIGTWQWMVTLLSTALVIPTMLNHYDDMFLLKPSQDILCAPSQEFINRSLCSYTITNNSAVVSCDKWLVKFMWLFWIKKTWLIFCDKMQLLSTTVICRSGLVFGCIIFGVISDSFGRRIAIFGSLIADLVFRLTLVFCDSESWYRLLIFLKSLFTSANCYLELILVCEIASNSWRTKLSLIVSTPRILASLCLIPFANAAPNLDTYNFITFLLGTLLLIILRWIPESPQWLLYNRKIPKAEKTLFNAAKKNGVKLCSEFKIRPVNNKAYDCLEEEWTCLMILSNNNVRLLIIVSLWFWALYNFLFAPLFIKLHTRMQAYSPLHNLSIVVFLGLLNIFIMMKIKMRYLLTINIIVLGSSTAFVTFLEQTDFNSTICDLLTSIGLASGLISYALLLNITPRLFAVNIRATLVGCCHAAGHLGTITCYLLTSLRSINDSTMLITTLAVTVILVGLCFIFPDVDGRELPDTIKDMDYFSELSKPLRWATQKTNSPSNEEVEIRVYSFSSGGYNITANTSEDTVPARPIGFIRVWYRLRSFVRQLLTEIRTH